MIKDVFRAVLIRRWRVNSIIALGADNRMDDRRQKAGKILVTQAP